MQVSAQARNEMATSQKACFEVGYLGVIVHISKNKMGTSKQDTSMQANRGTCILPCKTIGRIKLAYFSVRQWVGLR